MEASRRRDWQIRVAAAVVFLLGCAAGALGLDLYGRYSREDVGRPHDGRRGFDRMLDDMGLTEEQRPVVRQIFRDARSEMSEARRECAPRYREVRERTDARLREALTPEQWQHFVESVRRPRGRHHGPPDPPGDGPGRPPDAAGEGEP